MCDKWPAAKGLRGQHSLLCLLGSHFTQSLNLVLPPFLWSAVESIFVLLYTQIGNEFFFTSISVRPLVCPFLWSAGCKSLHSPSTSSSPISVVSCRVYAVPEPHCLPPFLWSAPISVARNFWNGPLACLVVQLSQQPPYTAVGTFLWSPVV